MKLLRTLIKASVFLKIANFKRNVKRIKRNSIKFFIVLFIILTIVLIWLARPHVREGIENYREGQRRAELPVAVTYETSQKPKVQNLNLDIPNTRYQIPDTKLPIAEDRTIQDNTRLTSYNLHIPFTPQAPHANWDMPYQEACEEAAVYMVSLYFSGDERDKIPADEADAELLKLIDWEKEKFGYYEDTPVSKVLNILKEYYGLEYQVYQYPTVDDIKKAISQGYPVIVPAYGKELPNPYFTGDGPLYHMLVIKGYTDEGEFITNDPGTRRGADYTYKYGEVMNVIHDWNDGDVPNGLPRVIVVKGPLM